MRKIKDDVKFDSCLLGEIINQGVKSQLSSLALGEVEQQQKPTPNTKMHRNAGAIKASPDTKGRNFAGWQGPQERWSFFVPRERPNISTESETVAALSFVKREGEAAARRTKVAFLRYKHPHTHNLTYGNTPPLDFARQVYKRTHAGWRSKKNTIIPMSAVEKKRGNLCAGGKIFISQMLING